MKNTLTEQYRLIKIGKGNKETFLKEAKSLFPNLLTNSSTYNETEKILKQKGVISENIHSLNPIAFPTTKKESYEIAFSKFLKEAKKEEPKTETYDNKNTKNSNNLIFDQIMRGCYVEAKVEKNKDKTIDEIKDIVVKNLQKDPIYYTKNGAFGEEGLGYETEVPGLGTPKEAKGKYKSSGYGDLKENTTRLFYRIPNEIKNLEKYGVKITIDPKNTVSPIQRIGVPVNLDDEIYDKIEDILYRYNLKPKKYFITQKGVNENKDTEIKIGDILIKNGKKGKVIKVMDDMVNVDFGNGDVYGITLSRIKGNEIVNENKDAEVYAKKKGFTTKKGLNENNNLKEGNDFGGAGLIVVGRTPIDNDLIDQAVEESGFYGIFNARENYWFFPEGEETIDRLENELETIFIKKGINARFEGQFNENKTNNQPKFKKGDKVTYLGHPGEITAVNKEMTGAITYNVAYNKGTGRTKATNIYNKDGEIKPLNESNSEYLDKLYDIILKYVKDPDEAEQELDGYISQGWSGFSNMLMSNLNKDMDFISLTQQGHDKDIQRRESGLNESYGSNGDFDGTGLIVVGRTQIDNNEIGDVIEDLGYYGVWNSREGYWFIQEDKPTLSYLEADLDEEFAKRDINARFEAQFGEDEIDYDDENFSDPLIDGEEDLFESKWRKTQKEKIVKENINKEITQINKDAESEVLESKLSKINDAIEKRESKLSKINEDEDLKGLTDNKKIKSLQKEIKTLEKHKSKIEKQLNKGSKQNKPKEINDEIIDETEGLNFEYKDYFNLNESIEEQLSSTQESLFTLIEDLYDELGSMDEVKKLVNSALNNVALKFGDY
jgi:hypothetical protein